MNIIQTIYECKQEVNKTQMQIACGSDADTYANRIIIRVCESNNTLIRHIQMRIIGLFAFAKLNLNSEYRIFMRNSVNLALSGLHLTSKSPVRKSSDL